MQYHPDPKLIGPLVFDSSAVFNFGHRGELEELLEKLRDGHMLIISPEVRKEICEKIKYKAYYEKLTNDYFVIKEDVPRELSINQIGTIIDKLGKADASVILLALGTNGTLIIDDKLARRGSDFGRPNYRFIGVVETWIHCQLDFRNKRFGCMQKDAQQWFSNSSDRRSYFF